jgi:small-conductance mechanosensitive channel
MCESVPAAYGFSGAVREAVLKAFRKNNIEIPYPTRTIEMKS